MRRRRRRLGTCGAYALPASRRPMRIAGAHGPRRGDSRPQAVFSELALLCPTAGDVLDMAKIESGHFDLREEETVVADVLASCLPRAGNVSLSARLTQDRAVEIRIADTGIGMKPDEIQLVLEPFRQIENTFNCQYNGAGLGLPLTGLRAATTGVGAPACRSRGPTAPLAKSSAAA